MYQHKKLRNYATKLSVEFIEQPAELKTTTATNTVDNMLLNGERTQTSPAK